MSSKFEISAKIPPGPESWEDEWKDEDLEDLDPDNSGGEFGAMQAAISPRLGMYMENKRINEGLKR